MAFLYTCTCISVKPIRKSNLIEVGNGTSHGEALCPPFPDQIRTTCNFWKCWILFREENQPKPRKKPLEQNKLNPLMINVGFGTQTKLCIGTSHLCSPL